ncbi:DUF1064 domain-containing protein [Yokenella regensburgei]|uniref:DUF1064 domain-containing protein n=1 Tax=Yokenella regensburgei TaxID=158877 RepID=UPI001375AFB1|nr:DUF1064 domain-containing protein [Yokenella regensburgei]KAF1366765.1 hypothetical protein FHR25_004730 [Yokenella regensburgei]
MRYTGFRAPATKKTKYGNKKTVIDDITFDSKKEADYYCELKLLKKAGRVRTFLMQVPFHLPGGVVYKADFMVFYDDGLVDVVDTKGVRTQVYILKKKQVEALYPVTIREI